MVESFDACRDLPLSHPALHDDDAVGVGPVDWPAEDGPLNPVAATPASRISRGRGEGHERDDGRTDGRAGDLGTRTLDPLARDATRRDATRRTTTRDATTTTTTTTTTTHP